MIDESRMLTHDWFPRPLPANVVLGSGTWLYSSHAFLHYKSERPCGLRVGHHTGIYIETFLDLGPTGEVEIGDYCTLAGPIVSTNGRISIGNYVLISRQVVIADSFAALPPVSAGAKQQRAEPKSSEMMEIEIGDEAWLGSRAVLLSGARIGRGGIVGAGAVVGFEVPPYAIVAGNPARIVGWARPGTSHLQQDG